ncbi:NAC domain containing protein [Parasponia andersonii]|uniref:NAC domain containing protein n=1 Tax=Parasponia andersonii TaxID=3476 RepID=A0A2P5D6S7_PARAD|nr:NAC domain containing protein [Parasponia andersonii]
MNDNNNNGEFPNPFPLDFIDCPTNEDLIDLWWKRRDHADRPDPEPTTNLVGGVYKEIISIVKPVTAKGTKTNWVMDEYRVNKKNLVLCKIYRNTKKEEVSTSEIPLN